MFAFVIYKFILRLLGNIFSRQKNQINIKNYRNIFTLFFFMQLFNISNLIALKPEQCYFYNLQ